MRLSCFKSPLYLMSGTMMVAGVTLMLWAKDAKENENMSSMGGYLILASVATLIAGCLITARTARTRPIVVNANVNHLQGLLLFHAQDPDQTQATEQVQDLEEIGGRNQLS